LIRRLYEIATSPALLFFVALALIAFWLYMRMVVLRLPPPERGYGGVFGGTALILPLGWYIAARGDSQMERLVGFLLLYMLLGVGILGVFDIATSH
jgi:hypothetical protein